MKIVKEFDDQYTFQVSFDEILSIHHALCQSIVSIARKELPAYIHNLNTKIDSLNEMAEVLEAVYNQPGRFSRFLSKPIS